MAQNLLKLRPKLTHQQWTQLLHFYNAMIGHYSNKNPLKQYTDNTFSFADLKDVYLKYHAWHYAPNTKQRPQDAVILNIIEQELKP